MLKNIKYIRFAVKVLKIIVVLNILNAVWGLYLNLAGAEVVLVGSVSVNNNPGLLTTGSYIYTSFVGIFIMYTAARGLDLFADVAERIMSASDSSSENLTTGD